MSLIRKELSQWRGAPLRELMAGAVATFALIPEVIAFAAVAGVDPQVGLFASFVIGIAYAVWMMTVMFEVIASTVQSY